MLRLSILIGVAVLATIFEVVMRNASVVVNKSLRNVFLSMLWAMLLILVSEHFYQVNNPSFYLTLTGGLIFFTRAIIEVFRSA